MEEPAKRSSSRLESVGLVGVALLPLVLALMATSKLSSGRPLDSTKQIPSLAFRQYAVNLHEIPATGKISVPFSFWNRGRQPIEITKLEPSCGCLAPKLLGDRKNYASGGQGIFEVQVETAREAPGPHTYSIRVHYQDEIPREEIVTFRVTVPERSVQITPPELYLYQLSDQALTTEIQVTDSRGKKLNVVEAKPSSRHLETEILPMSASGESSVTPIRVNVKGKLPSGSQVASVAIRTDDPDFPVIRVPVFLHGRPNEIELTTATVPAEPVKGKEKKPAERRPDAENSPSPSVESR